MTPTETLLAYFLAAMAVLVIAGLVFAAFHPPEDLRDDDNEGNYW